MPRYYRRSYSSRISKNAFSRSKIFNKNPTYRQAKGQIIQRSSNIKEVPQSYNNEKLENLADQLFTTLYFQPYLQSVSFNSLSYTYLGDIYNLTPVNNPALWNTRSFTLLFKDQILPQLPELPDDFKWVYVIGSIGFDIPTSSDTNANDIQITYYPDHVRYPDYAFNFLTMHSLQSSGYTKRFTLTMDDIHTIRGSEFDGNTGEEYTSTLTSPRFNLHTTVWPLFDGSNSHAPNAVISYGCTNRVEDLRQLRVTVYFNVYPIFRGNIRPDPPVPPAD